ncbi:hypothetical protein ABXS75_09625 [Roseburia hominis]
MRLLEVKGLTKKCPKFTLKNVSFFLEQGRIMGLIGTSIITIIIKTACSS